MGAGMLEEKWGGWNKNQKNKYRNNVQTRLTNKRHTEQSGYFNRESVGEHECFKVASEGVG